MIETTIKSIHIARTYPQQDLSSSFVAIQTTVMEWRVSNRVSLVDFGTMDH